MSFQTQPSLLGAIVWVLTGLTPTDAPDEIENASIHENHASVAMDEIVG